MPKVLVVEDSASARAFVRAILEEAEFAAPSGASSSGAGGAAGGGGESFQVTEATSGFDAMRLLPRGPYDLIITDINMADINGLELIHFIRKSEHHRLTPLVIISTLAAQRDVDRGLALGADAYLPKPFTAEQLRATCMRLLASARQSASGLAPHRGGPSSSSNTGGGEAKR